MSLLGSYSAAMPHDRFNVIDNSTYSDLAPDEIVKFPMALIPIFSERSVGEDNTLTLLNSPDALKKFGKLNYHKHGVTMYLADQYLAGGGSVLTARLSAADATHANFVLVAKTKIEDGVLTIEYERVSFTGDKANNLINLETEMNSLYKESDDDGYEVIPVMVVYSKPRGSFANNIGFRITSDNTMEMMDPTRRYYHLTVIENSRQQGDAISFCLDNEATFGNRSMFIDDVFSLTSPVVGAKASSHLYKLFSKVDDVADVAGHTIDVLLGDTANTAAKDLVVISPESVALTNPLGLKFAGGDCGAIGINKPDREEAMDELLTRFYDGEIVESIHQPYRYKYLHVFDTSDSLDVKNAVARLVAKRKGLSIGVYSGPITHMKPVQTLAFRADGFRVNTFSGILRPESAVIIDSNTGRQVRMPSTYFEAYALARHCQNNGFIRAFFGKKNDYLWTGFVPNSLRPSVPETMFTQFHQARINIMMEEDGGVAQPYQQITLQNEMSQLSELNNVHMLAYLMRLSIDLSDQQRGGFNEDEDVNTFIELLDTVVRDNIGPGLSYLKISGRREAANGAGRNRIRCQVDIVFKGILKGVTFNYIINPETKTIE